MKEKKGRTVSFIWYHNRSQRGGMCCSRCGMAEKIGKEHGVAELIVRLPFERRHWVSLRSVRTDIKKVTSEFRLEMKKIRAWFNICDFSSVYKELKNAFTTWKYLNPEMSSDHLWNNKNKESSAMLATEYANMLTMTMTTCWCLQGNVCHVHPINLAC